jgi:EAL domain-containing protein (putative c-di-GMP-specific phosphodiesterase class I)
MVMSSSSMLLAGEILGLAWWIGAALRTIGLVLPCVLGACWVLAISPSAAARAASRRSLDAELNSLRLLIASPADWLRIRFVPVIGLRADTILGFEARVQFPITAQLHSRHEWLRAADRHGCHQSLERAILAETLRRAAFSTDLALAVRLSPRALRSQQIRQQLMEACQLLTIYVYIDAKENLPRAARKLAGPNLHLGLFNVEPTRAALEQAWETGAHCVKFRIDDLIHLAPDGDTEMVLHRLNVRAEQLRIYLQVIDVTDAEQLELARRAGVFAAQGPLWHDAPCAAQDPTDPRVRQF